MTALAESSLPLPLVRRGKVRDVYAVGEARLVIVATDRVSAFDLVMSETVPHKGAVLTQLTAWWLRLLQSDVRHHMLSADADEIVDLVPALADHREAVHQRAMLVVRTAVFPVECVVRGYLSGSAWKEYREHGTLAGERLPPGLVESSRLDPPIFSPATKADAGHDENIAFARMQHIIGARAAEELASLARHIYERGRAVAAERGIVIADTKFEFGQRDGETILIDEVLTPDSSRFWPAGEIRPGSTPPSFDKQPLRDYLARERAAGRWDGEAPAPALPADLVGAMSRRYLEIFERLTGAPLSGAA